MFSKTDSWLKWMDHLTAIGADCEALDFCRDFGDMSIESGLSLCHKAKGFKPSWAVWVAYNDYDNLDEATTALLIELAISGYTDQGMARARVLYKKHKKYLTGAEKEMLLKKIFSDDVDRYHDFSEEEKRIGKHGFNRAHISRDRS